MPSIVGKYQHYKNEDVEEYLVAVGVPYLARKMMTMASPLMEITMDGDTMTIRNTALLKTMEFKFKLGEEYEEKMPTKTAKSVTTMVGDDELITEAVFTDTGDKFRRQYKFTDDGCVIIQTHVKAPKPNKRYFRRV